ncbi:MAG: hypothetical protein ACI8PT_001101 [Gammaproteobacteria bacterium]|jgi:hypothetical protein
MAPRANCSLAARVLSAFLILPTVHLSFFAEKRQRGYQRQWCNQHRSPFDDFGDRLAHRQRQHYRIIGGSGASAFAQIDPALVKLDVDGAITIAGGDGDGSSAGIVGDDIEIFASELSLFAGAGGPTSAFIQATAGDLTVAVVTVELGAGLGPDSHAFMSATGTFALTFDTCERCTELFQDPSVTPTIDLFGKPLELGDLEVGASSGADIADLLLTNTDDMIRWPKTTMRSSPLTLAMMKVNSKARNRGRAVKAVVNL